MEQTRYWMLPGTRHAERPPIARPQITNPTSYSYESWEERAFAQDYSCVWPPRSYSCTFCRREFRSAQALGGHMNVHRRDRARLRSQPASTSPTNEETPQNYDAEFVPHVGSFLFSYNPNLNPNPNSNPRSNSICGALLGPPISTSGSSNLLRKGKWNDTGLVSLSYSSATMNEDKEDEIRLISSAQLAKEPTPTRKLLDLEEFVRVKDFGSSLMKRNFNDMNTDEHGMISKRRRVETIAPPLVVSIPFNKQKELDIEIVEICPSPLEELDLELRLGDAPKLKKIA